MAAGFRCRIDFAVPADSAAARSSSAVDRDALRRDRWAIGAPSPGKDQHLRRVVQPTPDKDQAGASVRSGTQPHDDARRTADQALRYSELRQSGEPSFAVRSCSSGKGLLECQAPGTTGRAGRLGRACQQYVAGRRPCSGSKRHPTRRFPDQSPSALAAGWSRTSASPLGLHAVHFGLREDKAATEMTMAVPDREASRRSVTPRTTGGAAPPGRAKWTAPCCRLADGKRKPSTSGAQADAAR